jgi:hypothetical protein
VWSFYERPLIRFLNLPYVGLAAGGTVFRKAIDQRDGDFSILGVFL